MFAKVNKFRVKTFRPGYKVLCLENDPEYKELLELEASGKLRDRFPSRPEHNRHARNFHEANMLFKGASGEIKKELIVIGPVEMFLPDGKPNVEGLIDLDTEAEAKMLINSLRGTGDKRIGLDAFGLAFTDMEGLTPKAEPVQEYEDLREKPLPGKAKK